tara:strand:+ start:1190 stop:1921 length:732 start_codon:yes stop_codon:yes gene_type:complete
MKFSKNKIIKNEIWVFIPARSGSKSIKDKNLKKICGKPLIHYTLLLSTKIEKVKKIVFSSDSRKYLKIASKYKKVDCHLRSKKNSSDMATDHDVFKEYFSYILKKKEKLPEFFLHLRPTTPLRKKKTVEKILNFFVKNKKKFTSLRSVSELENSGFRTVIIKNHKLYSLFYKSFHLDGINKARQSFRKSYIPNGYTDIIKSENLINNYLHGDKVCPFIINEFNSDVDNIDDFIRTENYLKSIN